MAERYQHLELFEPIPHADITQRIAALAQLPADQIIDRMLFRALADIFASYIGPDWDNWQAGEIVTLTTSTGETIHVGYDVQDAAQASTAYVQIKPNQGRETQYIFVTDGRGVTTRLGFNEKYELAPISLSSEQRHGILDSLNRGVQDTHPIILRK